jgi:hypothetical protein
MVSAVINRRGLVRGAATLVSAAPLRGQSLAPGRLVVATQGGPSSLEPVREFSSVSWRIGDYVLQSLNGVRFRDSSMMIADDVVMPYGEKTAIDRTPCNVEYMDFHPANLALRGS